MAAKRNTSKKRESILDGALEVFKTEGYDKASMDRIAETAGASKRTVYNHFPGKEVLFKAVLNRLMDHVTALKQIEYAPGLSLEEQLGRFADAKMEFIKNPGWQGMLSVTIAAFVGHPELARETMMQAQADQGEHDYLEAWLAAADRDQRLSVPDPGLAADAFWSMVGGAFILPVIFSGAFTSVDSETMKTELIRVFMSGYRKKSYQSE